MINDTFAPFHERVAQLPRHCLNALHHIPRLGVAFIPSHLSHVSRRRSMKLPVVWEYQSVMCDSLPCVSLETFESNHCRPALLDTTPFFTAAAHVCCLSPTAVCTWKTNPTRIPHTHTHELVCCCFILLSWTSTELSLLQLWSNRENVSV
jgi:hypothetical protein